MRDRTALTIDPATGLAWRDGKILGRRNWEVHTETSIKLELMISARLAILERLCADSFD